MDEPNRNTYGLDLNGLGPFKLTFKWTNELLVRSGPVRHWTKLVCRLVQFFFFFFFLAWSYLSLFLLISVTPLYLSQTYSFLLLLLFFFNENKENRAILALFLHFSFLPSFAFLPLEWLRR